MKRRYAAVVRHVADGGVGTLGPILQDLGYELRTFGPVDEPFDPVALAQADLVVLLGGPMGAYEGDKYPFLAASIATARERLVNDKPLLGICLGSQLMATALGSPARPGDAGAEIGWKPIAIEAPAREQPIGEFNGLPVLHWHGDTFDLPSSATRLAFTDQYANQAFSFGRRALGLQFHIEVDVPMLERWLQHAEARPGGPDLEMLRRQSAQHAAALQQASTRFLARWLSVVDSAEPHSD